MKAFVFWLTLSSMLIATFVVPFSAQATEPSPPQNKAKDRIGTYDSRAIAVAFAGSAAQRKMMEPLKVAHKKAKLAGDHVEVRRLEAEGKALQDKAHRQAFSTAPVDDLLEFIADALPEIRRAAGVTTLISMWDEKMLARYPGAEKTDVTDSLVDAFQPLERQRKTIAEIRKQKPLALDKMKH